MVHSKSSNEPHRLGAKRTILSFYPENKHDKCSLSVRRDLGSHLPQQSAFEDDCTRSLLQSSSLYKVPPHSFRAVHRCIALFPWRCRWDWTQTWKNRFCILFCVATPHKLVTSWAWTVQNAARARTWYRSSSLVRSVHVLKSITKSWNWPFSIIWSTVEKASLTALSHWKMNKPDWNLDGSTRTLQVGSWGR